MTMMSPAAAIAANRFGLGARATDAPITDPQRWLIDQFGKFEIRPAAIAGTDGSAAMARQFREYLAQIRPFIAAKTEPRTIDTTMPAGTADPKQEDAIRRELRRQYRDNYGDQVRARVISAITTDAPFAERLVHFWANHFAVSADKLQTIGLAGTLEFEAIRPNITGTFGDLLMAVETHPAMLLYLDQAQSIGPDSLLGEAARRRNARRQPGLNENLAREILELHTLGVGNYAQADVQELARGLTGFSIGGFVRRPIGIEAPDGAFVFQPGWHQPGERVLLGKTYREAGLAQPRAMLADLAVHPATARHLATKLARHFVADNPPQAVIDRLAAAHIASGGDLMALYRVLIDAPESWATATPKFKTPWDWTVSALRATGTRTADLRVAIALTELGQPVWRPGSPAGWDDIAASWAAPDALLRRVETAGRLAAATGSQVDARALAPKILPGVLTPATAQAIARAETGPQALALLLASPEFLRR